MDKKDISLKLTSLLRKSGLAHVPRAALIGICGLGLMLVLLCAWRFWPRPSESFSMSATPSSQASSASVAKAESSAKTTTQLLVDIEGCVVTPGLYALEDGARIGDAIKAAGGLTEEAASGAVNLAQKLSDGDQVRIPSAQEATNPEATSNATGQSASAAGSSKININTASAQDLQQLSGIGPSLSERIIDYRESHGRFTAIEDLQKVSGIGSTRFENIKDKICI